jgi:Flp pilus assembly pilin Flp
MLALIVAVAAAAITSLGRNVSKTFSGVSSSMGS